MKTKYTILIIIIFIVLVLITLIYAATTISDTELITPYIEIGTIHLFQSGVTVGSLDLNGTFITRYGGGGNSSIRFAWAGADNRIRFAIPREGANYAVYNPRSSMIGGILGQAFNIGLVNCTAQGYRYIDCSTDLTGADLGLQDDFEFHGMLYGGNGTWNVSDEGNIETMGNLTIMGEYINFSGLPLESSTATAFYVCIENDGHIFLNETKCRT